MTGRPHAPAMLLAGAYLCAGAVLGTLVATQHFAALWVAIVLGVVVLVVAKPSGWDVSAHARAAAGAAGVTSGMALINLQAPGHPGLEVRVLASAVCFLGLAPSLIWMWSGAEGIPFLPALGAVYALNFGLPVFLRVQYNVPLGFISTRFPDSLLARALVLCLLGISCLYVGYAAARRLGLGVSALGRGWRLLEPQVSWGLLLAGFGTVVYLWQLTHTQAAYVTQFLDLASSLMILGGLILYASVARDGRQFGVAGQALVVLVIARALLGFGTGSNAQFFAFALPVLLLMSFRKGRLPWALALLGVVLVAFLQPVKTEFRARFWGSASAGVSPLSSGLRFVGTARDVVQRGLDPRVALDQFGTRFDYVTIFAQVVKLTPDQVPYWGGQSLMPLLTKPIPRAIWPSKPAEVTGQTFGHRYQFLSPGDTTTSWNMPQLVELYANFGSAGVVLGMLLVGLVYGAICSVLMGEGRLSWAAAIGASYVLSAFLEVTSGTSQVISGALYRWVALAAIAAVARLAFQLQPEATMAGIVEPW